jgi:hypothetical protein
MGYFGTCQPPCRLPVAQTAQLGHTRLRMSRGNADERPGIVQTSRRTAARVSSADLLETGPENASSRGASCVAWKRLVGSKEGARLFLCSQLSSPYRSANQDYPVGNWYSAFFVRVSPYVISLQLCVIRVIRRL